MSKKAPILLLTFVAAVFIFIVYGDLLFSANSHLFSQGRDGMKNYYTYSYHIVNDSSYSNFMGMNFPYGDSIFFTDGHPLLATVLKFVGGDSAFVERYNIGILNIMLISSIFVMFFVCYKLLKEFGIRSWFSVLFSIGMTLLSPQISRLVGGHLALSYSFALPLTWLLTIKFIKEKTRKDLLVYLLLSSLFWLFTHAYLGVICILFGLLIVIGDYVFSDKGRGNKVKTLSILSTLIVPILIFLFVSKATDCHTNRTDNPSGFFNYNAELDDVLVPHHPPLRPILDDLTDNKIRLKQEAWSYIGISTTLLLFVLITLRILQVFRTKSSQFLQSVTANYFLNISILASLVLLLFAFAFPFRIFPELLDYIPFIKQFRATGRFTWPFHFTVLVLSALLFQGIYDRAISKQGKYLALTLLLLVGLMNIYEGLPYHLEAAKLISNQKNIFLKENLPKEYNKALSKIDADKYQAIITLPYYFQGAESYSRPAHDIPLEASMILGFHTKLPVVNTNLGRTSIWENKNLVQLISPNFYNKVVEKDFTDTRPLLVIKSNEPLTESESYLFSRSKVIYQGKSFSLYSLEKDELFNNNSQMYFDQYKSESLSVYDGFQVTDSISFIFYNSFEDSISTKPFRGQGGVESNKKGINVFASFSPHTFLQGKNYDVSLWMNNQEQDALNLWFRLIIQRYDSKESIWKDVVTYFPEKAETIHENWSLVEMTFKGGNPNDSLRLVTIGKENSKAKLYADDLLIKGVANNVYKYDSLSKVLFYNNHEIKLID